MPRAIVIRENPNPSGSEPVNVAALEEVDAVDLGTDPVVVEVSHSGINYKDGLALTGRPGIVRNTPLVGGADLVGTVVASASDRWSPGDQVILNGTGLSETRHGGFAELARVPAEYLVRLPEQLTPARAAAIGTAGFTAALCVLRLEREAVEPGSERPVLVTGATGGVGSIAIALLARAGHHVVALTGRPEQYRNYLLGLGAAEILDRSSLSGTGRPLQSMRWAGVVDTVGGEVLANALAQTRYGGTVAACGLAGSAALPVTVMPFILRAVTLAGIDSVQASLTQRVAAWARLARDLDGDLLDGLTETVPLAGTIEAARRLMAGQSHGRIVVDVRA